VGKQWSTSWEPLLIRSALSHRSSRGRTRRAHQGDLRSPFAESLGGVAGSVFGRRVPYRGPMRPWARGGRQCRGGVVVQHLDQSRL